MLPVFVIRPFENETSCSYFECVKDAQEHASDGLVTDALMLRMISFFLDARRLVITHLNMCSIQKYKKSTHDSVKS